MLGSLWTCSLLAQVSDTPTRKDKRETPVATPHACLTPASCSVGNTSRGPAWPGCPLAAGAPPRLPGPPVCALRVPQAGVDLPEAPGEGTHTRTYVAAAPRTLSLPFGACSLLPPVWARGVWSRGALSPARGVGEKAQRGLPASSLPCEERALAHSASLQPVGTREAGKGQRKGVGRGRAGGQAH